MSRFSRSRLSQSEIALFLAPLALIALVGGITKWREQRNASVLKAPCEITQAFWMPDGHIVGLGRTTDQRGVSQAQFLRWDRKTGELETQTAFPDNSRTLWVAPDGSALGTTGRRFFSLFAPDSVAVPRDEITGGSGTPLWTKQRLFFQGSSLSAYDIKKRSFDAAEASRVERILNYKASSARLTLSPDETMVLIQRIARTFKPLDSPTLAFGRFEAGDKLSLVRWSDGRLIKQLPGDGWQAARFVDKGNAVFALAVTSVGSQPARADIARFSLATHKIIWTEITMSNTSNWRFRTAAFSPNGRLLLVPTSGGTFDIYKCSTGKLVGSIESRVAGSGYQPQFSPDGRYFLNLKRESIEICDLNQFLKE